MTVTLAQAMRSYGGEMVEISGGWPQAGHEVLAELAAGRDRFALIAGAVLPAADELVDRLRADLELVVVHLGAAAADRPSPPALEEFEGVCADASVIADIELLLWPDVHVDPLQFIWARARRRPSIAVWPGDIVGDRALFSAPGRPDYHDAGLSDVLILRPTDTRFPDDVPFSIERIDP